MNRTFTLLFTTLAALTIHGGAELHASCPDAQAGRMQSGIREDGTGQPRNYFEWYDYLGEHALGTSSTLMIDFAVIPFSTGTTYVGLDEIGGRTFFGLEFKNGMVNGAVPYDPLGWNDVKAVLSIADQSFTVTVNGVSSGPLPFSSFSTPPYTVASVQALRLHRFDDQGESGGWIDELSIVETGNGPANVLLSATFDDGPVPFDGTGSLLATDPPATIARPATCPAKMVSSVPAGDVSPVLSSSPAYPTPATTGVTIPYTLAGDRAVRLMVRDVAGELVYRGDLGMMSRGEHRADWNCRSTSGTTLPAGNYFYTIEAGEDHLTGKIQLAR